MLEVKWTRKNGWSNPVIKPTQGYTFSPFNKHLQFGITCTDAFAVYKSINQNKPIIFRPLSYAKRLIRSAEEITFPTFDPLEFTRCIEELVKVNRNWVPDFPSKLLVKPIMFSLESGLEQYPPTDNFILAVYNTPIDPLYPVGKTLTLWAENKAAKSTLNSIGGYYLGANYAIGIKGAIDAVKEKNCDDILWSDTTGNISETSFANIWIHWTNTENKEELITPLDSKGTNLHGIIKETVLHFAKEDKLLKNMTKNDIIPLETLLKAAREKRVFF